MTQKPLKALVGVDRVVFLLGQERGHEKSKKNFFCEGKSEGAADKASDRILEVDF